MESDSPIDVILSDSVLDAIERLTVKFSERATLTRAGGRHLRRGVLLHGPPGTGKTHTIRYLLSRLSDRTVFILSGQGLAAIGASVSLARRLQPAVVALGDLLDAGCGDVGTTSLAARP